MVNQKQLIELDRKHIWHPLTQMKEMEKNPPFEILRAQGCYFYTPQGPIIDAISSWWCKSLGHGHPKIIAAIKAQLDRFEHVIGAGTTHEGIVELAMELSNISGKQHVFFASDGASAVEIALKLSIQANQIKGQPGRNQFLSLKDSYHGDTLGALSVSDMGIYKEPFKGLSFDCHVLQDVPYVNSKDDPLWKNADAYWEKCLPELEKIQLKLSAIIVEPIVQGAAGLRIYSADFLQKLANWAKSHDIYFIADEIMTGFGRTGEWMACQHAGVEADLICFSKGLTAGALPLSCVMIDEAIYNLFYEESSPKKSFLHSHTYSGNALAVAAALASIKVLKEEDMMQQAKQLGYLMQEYFSEIANLTDLLINQRSLGAFVAADLNSPQNPNLAKSICREALKRGAFMRPLANSIYWLPPLNSDEEVIARLAEITLDSIRTAGMKYSTKRFKVNA